MESEWHIVPGEGPEIVFEKSGVRREFPGIQEARAYIGSKRFWGIAAPGIGLAATVVGLGINVEAIFYFGKAAHSIADPSYFLNFISDISTYVRLFVFAGSIPALRATVPSLYGFGINESITAESMEKALYTL